MRRYFQFVASHPKLVLCLAALVGLVFGPFILTLRRETSPDAFIPRDHSALKVKQEVDAVFHLGEPIAVGIVRDGPGGIFRPATLRRIQELTEAIRALPGIEPEDVTSLATESGVEFEDGEPGFKRFLDRIPETPGELAALKSDILDYELYEGTLVAADGSAACIVVRTRDESRADAVYRSLTELIRDLEADDEPDERVVVAGEAAVRSHMGQAVSDDALRMNFISPVVMALLIILTFRTVRGTVLPLCVIGGASALALGSMAMLDVPVYIITNGIFVVIMALAVADSLHLVGQYYEEQLDLRGRDRRTLVVDACMALWFPILMTTLTDVAGFFALFLAGGMPPIEYFGLFTCVGVLGALLFSYTVVPAGLVLRPLAMSRACLSRSSRGKQDPGLDPVGGALYALGGLVYRRRGRVLLAGAALLGMAFFGASRVVINDARLLAFKEHHPIVRATKLLNERFDGTGHLNIVLTAGEPDAMLQPDVLREIESLERFTEELPHVGGTHSLAGWVKRAHQKMHKEGTDFYAIPDEPEDTRFYLDVLAGETSPMAHLLREVVDESRTRTNLIVRMKSSEFIHQKAVIHAIEDYLSAHFGNGRLEARLAGRANLDYHWLRLIRTTHIYSVVLSAGCVLLITGLMFRSLLAGVLCVFTVGVAVLINYALMGFTGIPLGVGTSMFASIAIGAGVNSPIHMLDRLRLGLRAPGADPAEVFRSAFAFTGRVLFFTAFVLAVGFLLLCISEFRTLVRFGLLIGAVTLVSFLASVTLLPGVIAYFRPACVWGPAGPARKSEKEPT